MELLVKVSITGHPAVFSMFGCGLQAIVVIFAVIYVLLGLTLLRLVLQSLPLGPMKGGGGLRGLYVLFVAFSFSQRMYLFGQRCLDWLLSAI